MSMNTRDERLYHYQYRRPRPYNPTYNSNNLFDSLNMFIRTDLPPTNSRLYGRYSLPKAENVMNNRSDLIDYRQKRDLPNYSTISNEGDMRNRTPMTNDKDQYYVCMLEEKQRNGNDLRASGDIRASRDVRGYGDMRGPNDLRGSRGLDNPEYNYSQQQPKINYRLDDSLNRELQEFQTPRR